MLERWQGWIGQGAELARTRRGLWVAVFLVSWLPGLVMWLLSRTLLRSVTQDPSGAGLLFLVVIVGAVAGIAAASGEMGLFRNAVRGEPVDWSAFAGSLGTYFWRIAGIYVLVFLASLAVSIPLGFSAASGVTSGSLPLPGSSADISALTGLVKAVPVAAVILVAQVAGRFLMTYWGPAVALGGRTVFAGIAESARFAVRELGFTLAALVASAIAGWIVSLVADAIAPGAVRAQFLPPATPINDLGGALARSGSGAALAALTVHAILATVWLVYYRTTLWVAFARGAGEAPGAGAAAGLDA